MVKNRQLKYTWIASHYLLRFKENPTWSAKELVNVVKKDHGVVINKWTAYKAKQAAYGMLHDSMFGHYSKLGRYIEELKRSNLGSSFIIETDPKIFKDILVFQRMFVSFKGLMEGLLSGCRPMICIDGSFIKTFLGGCLLATIGMDGNNQMFPIAWVVVEGENNDSWEWFLQHLRDCLGGTNGFGWSFISNEHKAILHVVADVFPNCEHRHCTRHIYANWKKIHKGEELKLLFWNTAKAYNQTDLKNAIKALKQTYPKAAEDVEFQSPRLFCRAFMREDSKCDVIVNNITETFNAYVVHARTKHLIDMLEDIRMALMERIVVKRSIMEASEDDIEDLCPKIRSKLEKEKEKARNYFPVPASNKVFWVKHMLDNLVVDLNQGKYTCRKWNLTGIPCCHAIACAVWMKQGPKGYVHSYFKKEKYIITYEGSISPCAGERHWPEKDMPLQPPPLKVGPSRPKKNIRKNPHEDPKKAGRLTRHGRQMMCTNCKSAGHDKKGCLQPAKSIHGNPPPQKRQRSRPRKQHELLSEPREQGATPTRGRGGIRGMRGKGRSTSSGPQSMTDQGQSHISSQVPIAISSS